MSSPSCARAILGQRTLAKSQLSRLRALWTDSVWDDLSYLSPVDLNINQEDESKGEDEYEG